MLTAISAYSAWQSAPTLPLVDGGRADTDLLQIRGATGLEPVKAEVNTTPYGQVDGESYAGSTVKSRNIVLTIGLNPDWAEWTMASLRRMLFSYFMPKSRVRLVFTSDDIPPVEIYGYVEGCEPALFAKDVEIQVSIICPDPHFTAVDPTVITGLSSDSAREIDYEGSVEAGINVEMTSPLEPDPELGVADPENITVKIDNADDPVFNVFSSVPIAEYGISYFVLNSIPGQKYVRKVNLTTGVYTNLLSWAEVGYKWPMLQPGVNLLDVIAPESLVDWTLTYFARYGGL